MNTQTAYEKFIAYLEAAGRSGRTIGTYEHRLKLLLKQHGQKNIKSITPEDIDNFILARRRSPVRYEGHTRRKSYAGSLSQSTINGFIRDTKTFFRFCETRGYVKKSPAGHLKMSRVRGRKVKAISKADLRAILDLAEAGPELRDKALIRLLVDSGARVGELVGKYPLTRGNLNLEERTALVCGKTGERWIEFTALTASLLRSYLATHDNEQVFVSLKNSGRGMSHGSVWLMLKRYATAAGVKGKYGPHSIRHRVGYEWAKQHDLERTRQKLGHADISTTTIYANVDREEIRKLTDSTEIV